MDRWIDRWINVYTHSDKVSHPKSFECDTKKDLGYVHFNQPRILIGLTFEALRVTNFIEMRVYVYGWIYKQMDR